MSRLCRSQCQIGNARRWGCRQEQHFQPLAGNEVLKGFGLKLTPMSIAVPLLEIYMYQSLYEMV
ncbi:hypothetical protein ACEYW6_22510 [Nostoc sp. UIC 10607]